MSLVTYLSPCSKAPDLAPCSFLNFFLRKLELETVVKRAPPSGIQVTSLIGAALHGRAGLRKRHESLNFNSAFATCLKSTPYLVLGNRMKSLAPFMPPPPESGLVLNCGFTSPCSNFLASPLPLASA